MNTFFHYNTNANSKTGKLTKRILGLESLENRELLSVNPLALGIEAPDQNFVQAPAAAQAKSASQDFSTEALTVASVTAGAGTTGNALQVDIAAGGLTASASYKITVALKSAPTKILGTQSVTANGTPDPISATFKGLKANLEYTVTVTNTATSTDTISKDLKTLPSTLSAAGVTSSQATINWTKPVGLTATDKLYLQISTATTDRWASGTDNSLQTIEIPKGNSYVIPLSDASKDYYVRLITGTAASPVVRAAELNIGKPLVLGDGASVTVGPPTDVKAVFAEKSGAGSVKVTWKAPANYTGGYTVKFTEEGTTANNFTVNVLPGAKTEVTVPTGTFSGTAGSEVLASGKSYKVEITTTATKAIAATPTFVTTQKAALPATPVAPVVPGVPTTAALTGVPGGTTVKLVAGANETANVTVGFYVGLAPTPPTGAATADDLAKLIYVPKAQSGDTTVALVGAATDYVYAYAVGADGTVSATPAKSAAAITQTADVTTAPNTAYTKTVTGFKAVADTATKNTVNVSWNKADDFQTAADGSQTTTDYKFTVTGYRVTATLENGASIVKVVTSTDTTFTGLNWTGKYTFKVDALVTQVAGTATPDWSGTSTPTIVAAGTAQTKELTVAAAPKVNPPLKSDTPVTSNTGIAAAVKWAPPANATGTTYKYTVLDANKAVLASGTTTATTLTLDSALFATPLGTGVNLTPKGKYEVQVVALGSQPGTESAALKISVTAADYPGGTIKAAVTKPTITSITVTVAANTNAGSDVNYYVEYTSVVDAKGKPDWNASKLTKTIAAESAGPITITGLNPGTQYYVRLVTVNANWNNNLSGTMGDVTKSIASKEVKLKTVAVPLATVAKSGFAMSGSNIGFTFTGKDPNQNDTKTPKLLTASTTFTYNLWVSETATIDKVTGKLVDGVKVNSGDFNFAIATNTDATDTKKSSISSPVVTFGDLTTAGIQLDSLKALNYQLEVKYTAATVDYATTFSKVAKLAMPKWFV